MSPTDHLEVANLFARLSRALDNHEALDQLYTKDAKVHSPRGGELDGFDAITEYVRQTRTEDHTQHMNTDLLITLNGDEAQASANQLVHFYREGQPPHQTSGLRVSYTAVRTPEGWRFREAEIKLAWTRTS